MRIFSLLLVAILGLFTVAVDASPGSPQCLACIRTASSASASLCEGSSTFSKTKLARRSTLFRQKIRKACSTKATCGGPGGGNKYHGPLQGSGLEKETKQGAGGGAWGQLGC